MADKSELECALAERDLYRTVLLDLRRSDGHGGYIDCWCDSEVPLQHRHTDYCLAARDVTEEAG